MSLFQKALITDYYMECSKCTLHAKMHCFVMRYVVMYSWWQATEEDITCFLCAWDMCTRGHHRSIHGYSMLTGGFRLVFDSATGLAGLATKLSVLSRSRLSFTLPAKPAKPANFFLLFINRLQNVPKRAKYANAVFFPQKMFIIRWTLDFM
jgi:hypothetical protein